MNEAAIAQAAETYLAQVLGAFHERYPATVITAIACELDTGANGLDRAGTVAITICDDTIAVEDGIAAWPFQGVAQLIPLTPTWQAWFHDVCAVFWTQQAEEQVEYAIIQQALTDLESTLNGIGRGLLALHERGALSALGAIVAVILSVYVADDLTIDDVPTERMATLRALTHGA